MIKKYYTTIFLTIILILISAVSLFIGVLEVEPAALLSGDTEPLAIFLIS